MIPSACLQPTFRQPLPSPLLPTCLLTREKIEQISRVTLRNASCLELQVKYTNTLGASPKHVSQLLSLTELQTQDRTLLLTFSSVNPVFMGWSRNYGPSQVVLLKDKVIYSVQPVPVISEAHSTSSEQPIPSKNPTMSIFTSSLTSQEFDRLRKPVHRLFDQTESYINYLSTQGKIYFRVHKVVIGLPLLD